MEGHATQTGRGKVHRWFMLAAELPYSGGAAADRVTCPVGAELPRQAMLSLHWKSAEPEAL